MFGAIAFGKNTDKTSVKLIRAWYRSLSMDQFTVCSNGVNVNPIASSLTKYSIRAPIHVDRVIHLESRVLDNNTEKVDYLGDNMDNLPGPLDRMGYIHSEPRRKPLSKG